jgi:hypothetical protein
VGLERGSLSLVSTTEKLLERRSSGSGLENRDYGHREFTALTTWHPLSAKVGTNFYDARSILLGEIPDCFIQICLFFLRSCDSSFRSRTSVASLGHKAYSASVDKPHTSLYAAPPMITLKFGLNVAPQMLNQHFTLIQPFEHSYQNSNHLLQIYTSIPFTNYSL